MVLFLSFILSIIILGFLFNEFKEQEKEIEEIEYIKRLKYIPIKENQIDTSLLGKNLIELINYDRS